MTVLVGLDTETTGLLGDDGTPGDQRIIEIAMSFWRLEDRKHVGSWVRRIHPQRSITPKAQAVHGISIADLAGCPTWEDPSIGRKVSELLGKAQIAVVHNAAFDMPFIAYELMRIGAPVPDIGVFCTMEGARWATASGKVPTLGELAFALDIPYDPEAAHAALYDVDVMVQCLFKGIDLGFYDLDSIVKERSRAA